MIASWIFEGRKKKERKKERKTERKKKKERKKEGKREREKERKRERKKEKKRERKKERKKEREIDRERKKEDKNDRKKKLRRAIALRCLVLTCYFLISCLFFNYITAKFVVLTFQAHSHRTLSIFFYMLRIISFRLKNVAVMLSQSSNVAYHFSSTTGWHSKHRCHFPTTSV